MLLGWRGMELCTGLMVLATPTSVSAYSMAQMMGGNGTFAANQVGLSSVLGAVTVFFWFGVRWIAVALSFKKTEWDLRGMISQFRKTLY